MRASWDSLHAAVIRSVTSLPSADRYVALGHREPILAGFAGVDALLGYLARRTENLDDKDRIYRALVRSARVGGAEGRFALELAWCGMWPALDHIYRRCLYVFRPEPEDLTQIVWLAFTDLVYRIGLPGVRRLVGTLMRSTDRDVRTALQRGAGLPKGREPAVPASPCEPVSAAVADHATGAAAFDRQLVELREDLKRTLGEDTDLLLAVLVLGVSPRLAAQRLGLAYDATRKRLQRGVLRLRAEWTWRGPESLLNEHALTK